MNFIKKLFSCKKDSAIEPFLTKKDIKEAKRQGMPLSELVCSRYNVKKEDVISLVEKIIFPYLQDSGQNVLEIGTGIGRYAELVFEKFPTLNYYSFEPNKDLKKYLSSFFLVMLFIQCLRMAMVS